MSHSDTRGNKPWTKRRMLRISGAGAMLLGVVLGAVGYLVDWHDLALMGLVMLGVGAAWLICSRFACDEPMRPEARRYMREFIPSILAYFVILLGGWGHIDQLDGVLTKWIVALLPVFPMVLIVRAMLRFLKGSDELEQQIQLQSIAIAAMSVGLVSFAVAFLQAARLIDVGNLLMLVLPALFGAYGVASVWVRRKYRGD